MQSRVLAHLRFTAVALVFCAGALKLVDLPAFAQALLTWVYLPRSGIPFIALGVATLELLLSSLWLFGIARRTALTGIVAMLMLFTAAYSVHAILAHAPDCGCFGVASEYLDSRRNAIIVLLRNVVLLACLLSASMQERRSDDQT
jgi:hypothetical protein